MYAKIKTYLETLKSKVTMQRLIIGAICVLFLYGVGSLANGYFTARAKLYSVPLSDWNKLKERLMIADASIRELNKLIETSRQLNNDAGDRIKRIEDYQQREGESLNRIESNQRETGSRISESLEQNNRARAEL